MPFARSLACLLALPLGIATLSACGSDEAKPATPPPESWRGLAATETELALVDLTLGSAVTGTLVHAGKSIALSGSLNGRTATASGDGWTVTMTTDGSDRTRFIGNYTSPSGYAGAVALMKVRTGAPLTLYCGTYVATSAMKMTGPMGMAIDEIATGGVFAAPASAGALVGSTEGTRLGFTGDPPAGPGAGDISGNTIKGTWSFGGAYGDFDIATDRCPRAGS